MRWWTVPLWWSSGSRNVAADGTEQVAETIKKASADSFSGLVKGWQDEADKGVLGTFGTLYKAVKSQDWLSVGQWVLSTLYNGLAPETKLLIDDFGKNLIQQVNGFLGRGHQPAGNGAWDLGTQILDGLTGGFGDVVSQFSGLGSTLLDIFGGLQGPLSAAALAISKGLQGGLISAFPEILASLGGLIGAIGGAFVGNAAIHRHGAVPYWLWHSAGSADDRSGVALAAVIAGIVASLGGAFKKKSTPGTGQLFQQRRRQHHHRGFQQPVGLREESSAAPAHPAAQYRSEPVHIQQGADGGGPDARSTV